MPIAATSYLSWEVRKYPNSMMLLALRVFLEIGIECVYLTIGLVFRDSG
jgi:hypothetical protein